jgi:hypothetical protein
MGDTPQDKPEYFFLRHLKPYMVNFNQSQERKRKGLQFRKMNMTTDDRLKRFVPSHTFSLA